MTPQMIEALYRISLLHAPEPETIFQRIVEELAEMYDHTMAMVNVVHGDCIRFHTVVNTHPAFKNLSEINLERTLCQFSLRSLRPLLIQNAMEHPDFRRHLVVRLKLRRYLGVPICNPDGATVGTLCFLDDHTEQQLGEDDIQFLSLLAMRVSAELERERMIDTRIAQERAHSERLAALNRKLEENAEEKRRFVSMVIHDLRHPLTTLRTSLYLLRIETDKRQRLAHIEALESRTRVLGTLLDELVLYDQIEAGKILLGIAPLDPGRLIRDCIAEVAGIGGEQPVPIRCEIDPVLGTVLCDGGKLRHILLNLIGNALKFTHEGEIIVRAVVESADRWRLEVEDSGVGMTSEEQRRAFEEYFAGTRDAGAGVGLGLAIAHRLCTALNARITLESAPERGTRFLIVLPRRLSDPMAEDSDMCGQPLETNGAERVGSEDRDER
jgi:signal transduction histidine kinase